MGDLVNKIRIQTKMLTKERNDHTMELIGGESHKTSGYIVIMEERTELYGRENRVGDDTESFVMNKWMNGNQKVNKALRKKYCCR